MSRTTAILLLIIIITLVAALVGGLAAIVATGSGEKPAEPIARTVPEDQRPVGPASGPTTPTRIGIQKFSPISRTSHLQLLDYRYFKVGYDNDRRNPAWVTYDLDGPISYPGPEAKRPQQFATDERTIAKVQHRDYSRSGFDRGHMCPSYAMFSRYGNDGERATFVCTNIVPQPHTLNAGLWEDIETEIAGRSGHGDGWAGSLRHIAVINGPVYHGSRLDLPSGVEIPDAYFSVVFDYVEATGTYRSLAFEIPRLLPSTTSSLSTNLFLVSVKQIEEETGLDLYDGVDSSVRAETEATAAAALWP